jgi:hypothetical protein
MTTAEANKLTSFNEHLYLPTTVMELHWQYMTTTWKKVAYIYPSFSRLRLSPKPIVTTGWATRYGCDHPKSMITSKLYGLKSYSLRIYDRLSCGPDLGAGDSNGFVVVGSEGVSGGTDEPDSVMPYMNRSIHRRSLRVPCVVGDGGVTVEIPGVTVGIQFVMFPALRRSISCPSPTIVCCSKLAFNFATLECSH